MEKSLYHAWMRRLQLFLSAAPAKLPPRGRASAAR